MKTEDNLRDAFAGESQANRKYLAFARKADEEGKPGVAKLFRAVAEAETVHALNHLRVLGELGDTKDNLKAARNGEIYEFTDMYPPMIEDAKKDERQDAELSFSFANSVEKIHSELYRQALEAVEEDKDLEDADFYVCEVCGYTVEGEAPEVCPICGAVHEKFKKIE